jgi:hypothetical protein
METTDSLDATAGQTGGRMTRMELVKCGNPKCWRFVSRAVGSPRDTCDDACAIQRAAIQAMQDRTKGSAA